MRVFALILAALLLAACQPAPRLHTQESYVFGTRVEVMVWGEAEDKARAAAAEALHEFDRLHRAYHAWQPSELTALNEALAAGRSAEAGPELAAMVREAQDLAARGNHLFDPGIGRLIELWGFHDEAFQARLPDEAALGALLAARPSIADLRIDGEPCPPQGRPKAGTVNDPEPRSGEPPSPPPAGRGAGGGGCISSRNRAVALDLGGYLKGVALDRAAAILKRRGIGNALINIGGNVLALGSKGGKPWRVGIQHPREPRPLATLDLHDGEAIGTSGDYQRYFELDGRRYCHLLDPRAGAPAQDTQAVTVLIAPRQEGGGAGLWSDWASKPIFLAGDDWRAMAGRLGIAHVLRIDAGGAVAMTAEMRQRIEEKPPIR